MFRFAMSFLKLKHDAEDVVQDVMIKCWETIKEPASIENIEAFSMTLVRNKSLDKLKKKGRRYDEITEKFELSAAQETPYQKAEQKDMLTQMRGLIEKLPENQRSVLVLRDIEGFSYDEISEILDMNMGQVKINLHRGRKQVRTQLLEIQSYGLQRS